MRYLLSLCLIVVLVASAWAVQQSPPAPSAKPQAAAFDAKDIVAANTLAESIQIVDWLGPLAPVALSPFFGVTILSGLSLYGPEWVADNSLLGASGPLKNQTLFIVLAALTLLTSLPRLSKVSKPLAQALDQLETYSVIIILLAVKFLAAAPPEPVEVAMVQMGVFSVTADALLAIAMIINIIVINSVKFFFEFLVWLTPIPALDAIFEVTNKALCAALMTIYAFSPTLATIVNVVILLTAAVIFRWANRQVRFYRTMVADPLLAWIWPVYGRPRSAAMIVFPSQPIGPFKAKSKLRFSKTDDRWQLESASWFLPAATYTIGSSAKPTIRRGWLMHSIDLIDGDIKSLIFSRRYDRFLADLAGELHLQILERDANEHKTHERITREFA